MTNTPPTSANDATEPKPQAIRDGVDNAREQVTHAFHTATERTKDGIDHAKDAVSEAYATGKDRAFDALSSARDKARAASKSAGSSLEESPLATLMGGLVLGVIVGALLPRTQREEKILGSVGLKLQEIAKEATGAAKGAGRDKLAELGLSRDHARDTAKSLLDAVIAAAGSAGSAALDSAKTRSGRPAAE